jgi:hypothetical protein
MKRREFATLPRDSAPVKKRSGTRTDPSSGRGADKLEEEQDR